MHINQYPIRKLEEQFEPNQVKRIRTLQGDISKITLIGGAGENYRIEVLYALEAGLLLASLNLVCSLLELFVRDLLIYSECQRNKGRLNSEKDFILRETDIENSKKPRWDFKPMIDKLSKENLIQDNDACEIKDFYDQVRIPIQHGLSQRFINIHDPSIIEIGQFLQTRSLRFHDFERLIEDKSLHLIELAVAFMLIYGHHFR